MPPPLGRRLSYSQKTSWGVFKHPPPSGARAIQPIASIRQEQSSSRCCEALRRLVSKHQGVAYLALLIDKLLPKTYIDI